MGYDLIVVKTLERVYKNYYYIIRGGVVMAFGVEGPCYDCKYSYIEPDSKGCGHHDSK